MIITGNALHLPLADESVQCCVTSPPYWGLRDYGTARWEGGDPECDHIQTRNLKRDTNGGMLPAGQGTRGTQSSTASSAIGYRDVCGKCGAIRIDAQLGLEATPEEYVANMVAVFREVKRVLRPDGVVWLNIGDSYAGSNCGSNDYREKTGLGTAPTTKYKGQKPGLPDGLKPKDLVGIPWRVAFALQADGWWLRSDIIWAKPNPMPESVKDRCTRSHEYVFMLTKSARYYYDNEAVKEPCASGPSDIRKMEEQQDRIGGKHKTLDDPLAAASAATQIGRKRAVPASWHGNGFDSERHIEKHPDTSRLPRWPGIGPQHAAIRDRNEEYRDMKAGWYRNRRDVWTVATEPYKGAHFATMPTRLIEPCILASSRPGDVVLDPFSGAGTVGLVASRLGRRHIGVELSLEYCQMAEQRIYDDAPLLAGVAL